MTYTTRRLIPLLVLILMLALLPAAAQEALLVRELSPTEVLISQIDAGTPFIAYQSQGGEPKTIRAEGSLALIDNLLPGQTYVFSAGSDEAIAIAGLEGSQSVQATLAGAPPFTLRNYQMLSFLPKVVEKGSNPYELDAFPMDDSAEILIPELAGGDLYMLLHYTMDAGEAADTYAMWMLQSPDGYYAYRENSLSFSADANTEQSGFLALPFGELYDEIQSKQANAAPGDYLASLFIDGTQAASKKISITPAEELVIPPGNQSNLSTLTAELMGPGSVLLSWEGGAESEQHVVVYEKYEDPYYSYENISGNSLLINWLIPGRLYRFSVGTQLEEVRGIIYSDPSRYIDMTLPRERAYINRGFKATDVQVYRAHDGSDWYTSTDKHIISQDSAQAFEDAAKGDANYYLVVTYNFTEAVSFQPDALGLWVMQAPDGSEYFDWREMFLEAYDVQGARYSININNLLSQYIELGEIQSGTYTFSLYLDGMLAARTAYDLP